MAAKSTIRERVWISIDDPDNSTTWLFDANFLGSNYSCIYGQGCNSIKVEDTPDYQMGCCVHGAHMSDANDREKVNSSTERLEDRQWQFKQRAASKGGPLKRNKAGDWVTRKAKGACIFLNRDDWETGAGCALHYAALKSGENPIDWKPDVCSQVPIHSEIHVDEYGHETVIVQQWQRRHWGPGGEEFGWWCTEDPAAYVDTQPLYESAAAELVNLVGEEVYLYLIKALQKMPTPSIKEVAVAFSKSSD